MLAGGVFMKKILLEMLIICLLLTNINAITSSAEEKRQVWVMRANENAEYQYQQYSDILNDLPAISINDKNGPIKGQFSYTNYDNSRLGKWELQWVFTPDDPAYDTVTGIIKVEIITPLVEEPDEPTPTSLTATSVLLNEQAQYDINLNNKVSGSTYKWYSSDEKVVKVNPKSGLLTAVSEGTASVSCEVSLPDGTKRALISQVTVGYDENAPVLTETVLDLSIGDTCDINLENKIAKSSYRWTSSDRSVIKVNSSNGKVTAVGKGTAFVTCTITAPNNQVIVLKCDVNVE
jgi:hypothetical protein